MRLQAFSPLLPWAGLLVGAAAWFADQQLSADTNAWVCSVGSGPWAVGVGVVTAGLAAAAGIVSWRAFARSDDAEALATRRFAGFVGAASAAIFVLAIAFGSLAGLILPGCER